MGVELFFILSAYLMTSLLLKEFDATGSISIGKFFIRRILRIWPLYFFALFVGFFAIPVVWKYGFGSTEHIQLLKTYLLPYLLFLGNFAIANFGYPETAASSALALLWTISAEEQFYLFLQ